METQQYKVYSYRWVALGAFMLVITANQIMWITFAAITGVAASHYGVSDLAIGLLSMSFMVVYIFLSIPASWAIDTWGIKPAVGLGAVLTAAFGLARGLAGDNYTLILAFQIGIAVAQPFILNAITSVAARWFPMQERATASGFATLAMYLGIVLGLMLTPYLLLLSGIGNLLLFYGVFGVIAGILFLVFMRESPPTPACPPGQQERSLVFDGLKQILRSRDFLLLMVVFFIGLGVFNGVTTWIEDILRPRGFSITQAGITGGLMVIGGVVGALLLPVLSDRARKRVPFILVCLGGAALGLMGITIAATYFFLLAAAFAMGFFLLSAGPIGFQYGAEIAYPAPEGTSNGLLLMMGQISGIIFILAMDIFKNPTSGSMTYPLLVMVGLLLVAEILATRLRESSLIKK